MNNQYNAQDAIMKQRILDCGVGSGGGTLGQQAAQCQVEEPPEIVRIVNRLEVEIDCLRSLLSELGLRLIPVIDQNPIVGNPCAPAPSANTPLGAKLNSLANELQDMSTVTRTTLRLLAL